MSSLLNPTFLFYVEGTAGHARAGSMKTAHGVVKTPKLMPVGTQATVKALSSEDLSAMGADIILANTYHLYLRPGHDRVSKLGGIQRFMNWNRPMLTDSGGFQVFSLGKQMEAKQLSGGGERTSLTHITDDGVEFVSHLDGSKHFFSPERAIEIQQALGADIIMAFDECTPDGATEDYAREALDRTHRWAARCKVVWEQKERKSSQGNYQALFGIIQGAMHEPLRKEAAKYITDLKLDGIAFGGETIGYNMEGTLRVMEWVRSLLPVNVPRYAMGLGRDPQDILDAVRAGYDMFDCVAPTRLARNGALYNGKLEGLHHKNPDLWKFVSPFEKGRLQIGNAQWADDTSPIQDGCDCWTCKSGYTKAYLRHLYRVDELLYFRLASIHNVRFMIRLTEQLRTAILGDQSMS